MQHSTTKTNQIEWHFSPTQDNGDIEKTQTLLQNNELPPLFPYGNMFRLRQHVSELLIKETEYCKKIDHLEKENNRLTDHITTLSNENQQFHQELSLIRFDVENNIDSALVRIVQAERMKYMKQIQDLEAQLLVTSLDASKGVNDTNNHLEIIQSLEDEIQRLNASITKTHIMYDQRGRDLEKVKKQLNQDTKEFKRTCKSLTDQIALKNKTEIELSTLTTRLESDNIKYLSENHTLKKLSGELNKKHLLLKSNFEATNKKLATLEEYLKTIKEENEKLYQRGHQDHSLCRNQLETLSLEKNREINTLHQQLSTFKKSYQDQIALLQSELEIERQANKDFAQEMLLSKPHHSTIHPEKYPLSNSVYTTTHHHVPFEPFDLSFHDDDNTAPEGGMTKEELSTSFLLPKEKTKEEISFSSEKKELSTSFLLPKEKKEEIFTEKKELHSVSVSPALRQLNEALEQEKRKLQDVLNKY